MERYKAKDKKARLTGKVVTVSMLLFGLGKHADVNSCRFLYACRSSKAPPAISTGYLPATATD
jgi:hypothetical protein